MAIKRTARADSPVTPSELPGEEDVLELTLRPQSLQEYVGQRRIKEHLLVHMEAARHRKEPLGHTLLHGPPGLGKTTLAHIVAREMQAQMRVTSGPAIEKPGDLASLLTNLQKGDVLFIDEVHRLRPAIEEMLYSAMEDCVLDIMIGKGPAARSVRLTIQPFTLVAATTKAGAISAPLRDRFLHHFKLGFYELPEVESIIARSAAILTCPLEAPAISRIASASRATPRIANRLVRAIRDFAQVRGGAADARRVEETLTALDIDPDGLDATDRRILRALAENVAGAAVGLSTLAAMLAEEEETIEDVYEPYLLQQGYILRTPKGRMATRKAFEKLGLPAPEGQSSLFA